MKISVSYCTVTVGILVSATQGFDVRSAGDSKAADTGKKYPMIVNGLR
jgi:hypothetical protein